MYSNFNNTKNINESENISYNEDDYPTEERYYVYDNNDDCVSNEFICLEQAIAWAKENKYPIVKIHTYYRDPTRDFKIYPLEFPKTIWYNGNLIENK